MDRVTRFALILIGACVVAAGASWAARVSPADTATATSETLSPPATSDGYCVATSGTASLNLAAAAPARITGPMKAKVRLMEVRFVAGTTSTRLCTRLGGALPAGACDALDSDAQGILLDGNVRTLAVARDLATGALQTLDAQANAGSDGAVCVTLYW
jgi:hypothetical protein